MTKLTIGSLFAGIGGLELGLERAGMGPVEWQVELDPFCRKVLAKHWPDARRFEDVRKVGSRELDPVDVICGGFPCQDISTAGAGAGLEGKRSGLWWEFFRIVTAVRPQWVVVENIHQGWRRWAPFVRQALEGAGWSTVPLRLAAADLGAPHRRARAFVVAHPDRELIRELSRGWCGPRREGEAKPLIPSGWTGVPRVERAGDGIPHRVDRNRALGNAVVPQVAEVIGRAVLEAADHA